MSQGNVIVVTFGTQLRAGKACLNRLKEMVIHGPGGLSGTVAVQ